MQPYRLYIPEGSTEIRTPGVDAVAYCYSKDGKPYAVCYVGRSKKASWHFRFLNDDNRAARINETFANVKSRADRKALERAERRAFSHSLKVGDILVYSWGYEQTNIDYFQVTAVPSGKAVRVREIGGQMTPDGATGPMSGHCVPVPDSFKKDEKEVLKRVRLGNHISMDHGSAHLWEGRPNYVSWYA